MCSKFLHPRCTRLTTFGRFDVSMPNTDVNTQMNERGFSELVESYLVSTRRFSIITCINNETETEYREPNYLFSAVSVYLVILAVILANAFFTLLVERVKSQRKRVAFAKLCKNLLRVFQKLLRLRNDPPGSNSGWSAHESASLAITDDCGLAVVAVQHQLFKRQDGLPLPKGVQVLWRRVLQRGKSHFRRQRCLFPCVSSWRLHLQNGPRKRMWQSFLVSIWPAVQQQPIGFSWNEKFKGPDLLDERVQ